MDLQIDCKEVGFVHSKKQDILSYISDLRYLEVAEQNRNIRALLWDSSLGEPPSNSRLEFIPVVQSKLAFLFLQNSFKTNYAKSQISASSSIAPTAVISNFGVSIGENVVIEDFVVIKEGTSIGSQSIIRSGTVLGSQALSVAKDGEGLLREMQHLGGVHIGADVTIGSNCVIDKAIFRWEDTVIGDQTKIGALTNISHGVQIGNNNNISAGVNICGYTVLGNDSWVGPNVTISHMLKIGSRVYLSMSSTVLQDINDEWKVVQSRIFRERKLF